MVINYSGIIFDEGRKNVNVMGGNFVIDIKINYYRWNYIDIKTNHSENEIRI